jgi:acetylglutamate synthase
MTPEPETETPKPVEEQVGFPLDVKHYIAALERKNAQLLRENTALDAVVAQLTEEKAGLITTLEEAMNAKPQHNGRVTVPKPKRNTGKKAN